VWYKYTELERFKARVPAATLAVAAKMASPARDFRGAILAKQRETGRPGARGWKGTQALRATSGEMCTALS